MLSEIDPQVKDSNLGPRDETYGKEIVLVHLEVEMIDVSLQESLVSKDETPRKEDKKQRELNDRQANSHQGSDKKPSKKGKDIPKCFDKLYKNQKNFPPPLYLYTNLYLLEDKTKPFAPYL